MQCRFCAILGAPAGRILREGKYVFAILSDPRLMKGHVLVIPKRHTEKLSELSAEERGELMDEVISIEERLLTKASGVDLVQNYRPFIPENDLKVDHLHMHLRPRELNDAIYEKVQIYERGIFAPLIEAEIQEYRSLLAD